MMSSTPHTTQSHSRLIRFLSDLALVDFETVNRDFAERLGLLLNFSDSILLADTLKTLPDQPAVDSPVDAADVRVQFLRARGALVDTIVSSCVSDSGAKIKWPVPAGESAPAFDSYWRFYAALQRELDMGVRALRSSVRQSVGAVSDTLRQLVALDVVLEDILWDHSRRLLAVVPRFLEKRFHWLQQQPQVPDWLLQFSHDVQGLLLAELELRLQPVLGLVEALNNEDRTDT